MPPSEEAGQRSRRTLGRNTAQRWPASFQVSLDLSDLAGVSLPVSMSLTAVVAVIGILAEILPPGWEEEDWSSNVPKGSGLPGTFESPVNNLCACACLAKSVAFRDDCLQWSGNRSSATCCATEIRTMTRTRKNRGPTTLYVSPSACSRVSDALPSPESD